DDLYEKMKGELLHNILPPQANEDLWKTLTMFLDLIDKQGENAAVQQGAAPSSWSGIAIENQQQAGQLSILFRSKRTETMLKYLAKLMVGGILDNLTPEELAQHVRKY